MYEIVLNLHMHTKYSDGTGSHIDIVQSALKEGLDAVIVTDHDILVKGLEGYHHQENRNLLLLVGEEVHDRYRQPQKNHLIVYGADQELAYLSPHPQALIDKVNELGGVSFIAHPHEESLPFANEEDITWVNWEVEGFTGIELWNGFSELKTVLQGKTKVNALFYAYFPRFIAHAPQKATVQKWDELLTQGRKVVAVGGSDAHALHLGWGPLRATLFPYEYHFRCINTHLLLPAPLTGNLPEDRNIILTALRQGHAFVAYDLPHSTKGFQFFAQGEHTTAWMGDDITLDQDVVLKIHLPHSSPCRLLKDGQVIASWKNCQDCSFVVQQPGVYRVECHIRYLGKLRSWIFSNPIYIRPGE